MKLYSSVLPILSVVHHVTETPNDLDIINQENAGTGVVSVEKRLFVLHTSR